MSPHPHLRILRRVVHEGPQVQPPGVRPRDVRPRQLRHLLGDLARTTNNIFSFLLKQIFLTHTKIFSHLVDDDGAELLLGVVVLELVLVQRGAGEQVVLVRRLPHLLVQEPDNN